MNFQRLRRSVSLLPFRVFWTLRFFFLGRASLGHCWQGAALFVDLFHPRAIGVASSYSRKELPQ